VGDPGIFRISAWLFSDFGVARMCGRGPPCTASRWHLDVHRELLLAGDRVNGVHASDRYRYLVLGGFLQVYDTSRVVEEAAAAESWP